jgi:Arc/MetJ-type ribon-helix-helix transcriptional regulator
MKNITIALPEIYVENLEKLQQIGLIPSRSEGIRLAIREFLKKEVKVCQLLGLKE